MRLIPPAMEAYLTVLNRQGLKPINWIKIQFNSETTILFSDKVIPESNLVGKILEMSPLDDVANISTGSNTSSVSITLDDTSGLLKEIFNFNDLHKKWVWIYQWFEGLPLSESFQIFEGVINTPIVWKEGDRTLSFTVVTLLEDREVGFSADDGSFINVPVELIGKPWPIPFGTVINMPALLIDRVPTGATLEAVGIPDTSLQPQINQIDCQTQKQAAIATCLSLVGADLQFRAEFLGAGDDIQAKGDQYQQRSMDMHNQIANQMQHNKAKLEIIQAHQVQFFDGSTLQILNGTRFPQNIPIGIKVGTANYYGIFHGNSFSVISRSPSLIAERDASLQALVEDFNSYGNPQPAQIFFPSSDLTDTALKDPSDPSIWITPTQQDFTEDPCIPGKDLLVFCNQNMNGSPLSGPNGSQNFSLTQKYNSFFWADAGTVVKPGLNYPLRFVASIIPGTEIIGVAARRSVNGVKILTAVPPDLYTITNQTWGNLTAVLVILHQPLSAIEDLDNQHDWEDQIYLTLRSPIGPNVVDVLKYIIQTWGPNYQIDNTSFDHVHGLVSKFPVNFVLEERKNLFNVLQDICYQARLMIFLKGNVFFLRYLPEAQIPVFGISTSDIFSKTIEISTTPTEEIFTEMKGTWRVDLQYDQKSTYYLQNNVPKYGLIKKEVDMYIYNDPTLVEKSLIYWLIRGSNSFKIIRFKGALQLLKLEVMDTVTLSFDNNLLIEGAIDKTTGNEGVNGIVQKANYNSGDFSIDMEIWVPVRAGEMQSYRWAFPALIADIHPDIPLQDGQFPSQPTIRAVGDFAAGGGIQITDYALTSLTQRMWVQPGGDIAFNPPNIQTTLSNWAPAGVSTDSTQQVGQSSQRPIYNPPNPNTPITPLPRPTINFGVQFFPGYITGKVGPDTQAPNGMQYNVAGYPNGLDQPGINIVATQVQQRTNDVIKNNTWVMIFRTTNVTPVDGSAPNINAKFWINQATWA